MKRDFNLLLLAFALSLVFVVAAAAQEKAAEDPLEGFPEFVEKIRQEWEVPGLAVGIVKDGKLILAQGFGRRDVDADLPVTAKTLFAIGSCSKAFTALILGMLNEEAKIEWDEPVRTYLPDFKLQDDYMTMNITPRDLVCHRSGLPRHDASWYGSSATREELFRRMAYFEPSEGFRDVWQYNNFMFMTAGYLAGKVEGTTWEELVREKIFTPLGMERSNFSVNDSQADGDFSQPYGKKDEKVSKIPFRNIDAMGPAGSINSCIEEMANWVILQLNKGKFGEKQVAAEGTITATHTPQMAIRSLGEYKEALMMCYAMGWGVGHYRGHLTLQHGGGIDGFISHVSFMPHDKIGVIVLTNLSPNPVTSVIANNAYDRLLGLEEIDWNARVKEQWDKMMENQKKAKEDRYKDKKEGTKPSHPLADYAGKYENPGYGQAEIVLDGDKLKSTFNGMTVELEHFHYDVFMVVGNDNMEGTKLTFQLNDRGDVEKISTSLQPGVKPIIFTRMPEEGLDTKEYLEKFVGEYEIMGQTVKLEIRGENKLFAVAPNQPPYELIPTKENEFKLKGLEGFSLTFTVDAEGNVTEAVFHQPNGVFTAKRKQ